jgi:hypothetical protein
MKKSLEKATALLRLDGHDAGGLVGSNGRGKSAEGLPRTRP